MKSMRDEIERRLLDINYVSICLSWSESDWIKGKKPPLRDNVLLPMRRYGEQLERMGT